MSRLHDASSGLEPIWINPIGGLGDMLMVSGVIKQMIDRIGTKFNLVRRSYYRPMFKNHPAIKTIGFPPEGSRIIGTDYWAHGLDEKHNRPYQILARLFGLPTPVEEKLYFPDEPNIDKILEGIVPWSKKNIVLMAGSDSPRKMMSQERWGKLVRKLKEDGFLVMQVGKMYETYIKGTYSLLGLTSPGQLISLIRRADVVITIDSFAMHAAHLTGTPAVVLWGPTSPEIYGYPRQIHLREEFHCDESNQCLGPETPKNYNKPCPLETQHCMNLIPVDKIYEAVLSLESIA